MYSQRFRRLLGALVVLACTLSLMKPIPGFAAAMPVTTNETEVLSFTIDNPCSSEPVLVSGMVHRVTQTILDPDHGTLVFVAHGNYQDLNGAGLISGTRYHVTGPYTTIQAATPLPPFTLTTRASFQLTGEGANNNFVIEQLFHITINAIGEVTTIVDSYSATCR